MNRRGLGAAVNAVVLIVAALAGFAATTGIGALEVKVPAELTQEA